MARLVPGGDNGGGLHDTATLWQSKRPLTPRRIVRSCR